MGVCAFMGKEIGAGQSCQGKSPPKQLREFTWAADPRSHTITHTLAKTDVKTRRLLHANLTIFLSCSPLSPHLSPRCRCDSENRYLGNPLRGTCYCKYSATSTPGSQSAYSQWLWTLSACEHFISNSNPCRQAPLTMSMLLSL